MSGEQDLSIDASGEGKFVWTAEDDENFLGTGSILLDS